MSFRNYRLQNRCLCKGLKSDLSVYPGTINMLKGRKYCCDLHDSTFIRFVHHSWKISVGKSTS